MSVIKNNFIDQYYSSNNYQTKSACRRFSQPWNDRSKERHKQEFYFYRRYLVSAFYKALQRSCLITSASSTCLFQNSSPPPSISEPDPGVHQRAIPLHLPPKTRCERPDHPSPQIASAVLTTSSSLRRWSSAVIELPSSVEAKPHWGAMPS